MANIGPLEIAVVLIIALVILGPKKLPDMGRSVGRGMREFKEAVTGNDHDDEPAKLAAAEPAQPVAPQPQPAQPVAAEPAEPVAEQPQRTAA